MGMWGGGGGGAMGGGASGWSNEATAATLNEPPAPPTGLAAASVSRSQIDLTWTERSTNATGFELFRRTGRGVEATYVGRTFLQHAERAVAGMLGLSDTARQLRGDGPRGSFSIGFSSGIAAEMAPRIMASLALTVPRVRLAAYQRRLSAPGAPQERRRPAPR